MPPKTLAVAMTALAILAAVFIIQTRSNDAAERDAVRHILAVTFDKPDSPLGIEAIVVRDGVAIADWIQGDRGGRALLRRGGDAWSIILCGGDGLKDVSTLKQVGLSPDRAKALSDDLSLAEAKLSSARLALISSFDGLVRIDQGGAHPPPAHH